MKFNRYALGWSTLYDFIIMHGTNNIKSANNMCDYAIITRGTQHTRHKMFQTYRQPHTSRTKRHIKPRNNLLPRQMITYSRLASQWCWKANKYCFQTF